MRQGTWNIDYGPFRGLYCDRDNGWIFGVCAGIADRFNLQVGVVRIVALICLFVFFLPTAAIYIAATLLIRDKPLMYSGTRSEYEFWRRSRCQHWREL